jgi:DNA-binding transcriptional LysR family regulator
MKQDVVLDWEDIRYFAALARHGTLLGAARRLKATPEIVARRLESLERTLGYAVFTREAGALVLNSAGAAALGEAAQMEMAACSLLQKHPPGVSKREANCTGEEIQAR